MSNCVVYIIAIIIALYMVLKHFGKKRLTLMSMNDDKYMRVLTVIPLVVLELALLIIVIAHILFDNTFPTLEVVLFVASSLILWYYVLKNKSNLRYFYNVIMSIKKDH